MVRGRDMTRRVWGLGDVWGCVFGALTHFSQSSNSRLAQFEPSKETNHWDVIVFYYFF